jgi:putative transposase
MPKHKETKFAISEDDLIIFDRRNHRFQEEFDGGIVIHSDDDKPRSVVALNWQDINGYIRTFRLQVEKGHYSTENAILRAKGRKKYLQVSPEDTLKQVMVIQFLEEEQLTAGPDGVRRSDAKLKKFYAKFKAENEELVLEARDYLREKKAKRRLFVGRRQFCRWIDRYLENQGAADSLARQNKGRLCYGTRFSDEQQQYFHKYAREYLSENEPTVRNAFELMEADHLKNGLGFELCSYSTFLRLVNDMDDRDIDLGRGKDKHRVQRKHMISGKGLRATRPMEILEMDEHKLDLIRVTKNLKIWDLLHPDVQTRIKANPRPWASVALDTCSRSICGMRVLAGEPEGAEAVATLAMAVRSKEGSTALSGEPLEWPQCGRPAAVHTDAGAAYISAVFQQAVISLTGKNRIPPSKHPHLRGRVERFFKTINSRYMHLNSGRTFSNVLMKDKYNPERHAHITHQELCDLLLRLIVQCYHNTPHRQLNGETPLERWYRASHTVGEVTPPPTDEEYRDIFGIQLKRKIGNYGITILGNTYLSPELSSVREWKYNVELDVRLNDQDISSISFLDPRDNEWKDAKATFEGFDKVPLTDWMETVRYILSKHGPRARNGQRAKRIMLSALSNAVEISKNSRTAAGVGAPLLTEARIVEFEKKKMAGFEWSRHLAIDYGDDRDGVAACPPVPKSPDNDPMNPVGEYDSSGFIDPQDQATKTKKDSKSRSIATVSEEADTVVDTSGVVLIIEEMDGSDD